MTIRSHLLLLALAAVLPILAFGLFVSLALVQSERETQRVGAMDQARAISIAVEAQLRGSIATLEALAASRALVAGDLPGFRLSAERVLATQPSWMNVALSTPDGARVMDLATPPGAPPGRPIEPESFAQAVSSARPQIGELTVDPPLAVPGVPVRVPVLHQGRVRFVLMASVRPESFARLIFEQHLPTDWLCAIADRQMRFVARVPYQPSGALTSPALRQAAAASREGWYRGLTLEKIDTFTAHVTSPFSGWTVALAIPASTVEAVARRSAWLMAIGAVCSVVVAFSASLFVGWRIVTPIRALGHAARSIGRGGDGAIPRGSVRELDTVAEALHEAAVAVRDRQALLEREKEALQGADLAKNEFLAMLSHELRNPLAALRSAAHVLKLVDPAHRSAEKARAVIERQTGQMTRLIEDLLDISRITMGKASLERQRLELADTVARVVEAFRDSGRSAGHRVELVAAPVWIHGDRERIDQIVSNLLDNAVKYTPSGGRIRVTVAPADGRAMLRVEDEGQGIAPELLGRVFDLFVQGPRSIDRGEGGMGLGLALVKRLTEMHGGTVAIASGGPGKGTTLTVSLPAVEAPAQAPAAPSPRPSSGARRILLVEDNDDARAMMHEALRASGHEIREAKDGKGALEAAEAHRPEVAIVDIGLPDMDGYEVARRLREALGSRVTLIALTGYGQPEDRLRAYQAGFGLHMTKPVELERLEAAIAALTSGPTAAS